MKKPLYLLLGLLAIFVIVYFLLIQKEKKTFRQEKVENFLQLDSAAVNRFEFNLFDTKLAFEKTGQQWYMRRPDSCRADNRAVEQMLSMASRLEVGEIISSNPEKQFVFQVDTVMGNRLDFFDGENLLASMVIGKMQEDRLHAYLRKTDSDDVYLAKGLFSAIANRRLDLWKDRSLFVLDPKQASEIELSQDQRKFKLTREDTLWLLSAHPYQERSPADGEAVEEYLGTLADMKIDEFLKAFQSAGISFKAPQLELQLTFPDGGQEKVVAVAQEGDDSRYFVKTDQDKNVFVLYEFNFKRIAKTFRDFQPKEEE
ncbi:MAG: DUF4340 domain-containing protein [Candidatus Zixiibacteriota bacterium]|nr:MAG: DUF4340 domain-containing protein [candidate division Zixibacteria bacterium]